MTMITTYSNGISYDHDLNLRTERYDKQAVFELHGSQSILGPSLIFTTL